MANETFNPYATFFLSVDVWFWVVHGIITIITVLGNALVVYILCSRKNLLNQESPNGRIILSLGIADLLVGVFNWPAFLTCIYGTSCGKTVWAFITFFVNVTTNLSVTNLCLLTLDRYIAVVHPFSHIPFTRQTNIVIALFWFIPFLTEIPHLFELLNVIVISTLAYRLSYIIIFTILPNIFMCYAYTKIGLVLFKHHKQINAQHSVNARDGGENSMSNTLKTGESAAGKEKRQERRRHKDIAAVGMVVAIFLVCNSIYLYWLGCNYIVSSCVGSNGVTIAAALTSFLNSAPNFFVYAIMKSDFRKELKKMFKFFK
ncbi:dopamine receptor 4 [Nematostella vectensis]|uniref:dopamine receptor 4 n=1 Tax=Nematostella vectensis TaxID=45351 RepID=UPI00139064E5|nr:dopamine receptor 4 [Nematostella vectensis]